MSIFTFNLSESVQPQLEKKYYDSINLEDALKIGMSVVSSRRKSPVENARDIEESFTDVCVISRPQRNLAPRCDMFLQQKTSEFILETLKKKSE